MAILYDSEINFLKMTVVFLTYQPVREAMLAFIDILSLSMFVVVIMMLMDKYKMMKHA
jgi:hypothetical protein